MPYLDYSPDLAQASWVNCVHPAWRRAGIDKGKQRWKCMVCGKGQTEKRERRRMEEIVMALGKAFREGRTLGYARRVTRTNAYYAAKYYNMFRRYSQ